MIFALFQNIEPNFINIVINYQFVQQCTEYYILSYQNVVGKQKVSNPGIKNERMLRNMFAGDFDCLVPTIDNLIFACWCYFTHEQNKQCISQCAIEKNSFLTSSS